MAAAEAAGEAAVHQHSQLGAYMCVAAALLVLALESVQVSMGALVGVDMLAHMLGIAAPSCGLQQGLGPPQHSPPQARGPQRTVCN